MYIFLDCDGVLNTTNPNEPKIKLSKYRDTYVPRCVQTLNALVDSTGAGVILTSTWRKNFKTLEKANEAFNSIGFNNKLIGMVGTCCSGSRGVEIRSWLKHHDAKCGTPYVIIDDEVSDLLYGQRDHIVKCDPYSGLTPTVAYLAERILNKLN